LTRRRRAAKRIPPSPLCSFPWRDSNPKGCGKRIFPRFRGNSEPSQQSSDLPGRSTALLSTIEKNDFCGCPSSRRGICNIILHPESLSDDTPKPQLQNQHPPLQRYRNLPRPNLKPACLVIFAC